MGAMEIVRRGDDESVHRRFVQHRSKILGAVGDAESRLHSVELGLSKPADGNQLHIGARFQNGQVVSDRPPTRARHANAQFSAHAPSPTVASHGVAIAMQPV